MDNSINMNKENKDSYNNNIKNICRVGSIIYGGCMMACILCGTILGLRFEVSNVMLIICAVIYAIIMSKIDGDYDVLRNRNILICSGVTKIIVMMGVLFESSLWGTDGFNHQYDRYYYLVAILVILGHVIETLIFVMNNHSAVLKKYILVTTVIIFIAFCILDNSVWGFLLIVPMLTMFSQCDNTKLLKICGICSCITVVIASYSQIYYFVKNNDVCDDIFSVIKNAVNNTLADESKEVIFCYIIIVILMGMHLFAVIRVINVVNIVNDRKISVIESEESKIRALVDKIVNIEREMNDKTEVLSEEIEELYISLRENKESLLDIIDAAYKNEEGIEYQSHMAQNISSLVYDIVKNVNEVSDRICDVLGVVENSRGDFTKLKVNSDKMYKSNKAAIDIINDFVENVQGVKRITQGIEYISDETNLVSINTSIMSKKAGSAGESFAVVAKEIYKLAEDTSTLTDNINEIIKALEQSAYIVQDVIREMVESIREKKDTLDESIEEFGTMEDYMGDLGDNVSDIWNKVENVNKFKDEIEYHINRLSNTCDVIIQYSKEAKDLNADSLEYIDKTSELIKSIMNKSTSLEEIL